MLALCVGSYRYSRSREQKKLTQTLFIFLLPLVQDDGKLVCVIGDEDTVTGFLLAGVGHRTAENSNFLIVKSDTTISLIEETFKSLTSRSDVGIVLINQHIANEIRHLVNSYTETIPTVLEIPSKVRLGLWRGRRGGSPPLSAALGFPLGNTNPKIITQEHPYDPTKDYIMQRVQLYLGAGVD